MQEEITYELCLVGTLDQKWATFFKPFTLVSGADTTLLIGVVHDQAELFGVLLKVRDLGLRLISVNPLPKP